MKTILTTPTPHITVRAEIITELILERAHPVIFETFFTGINTCQTDSSNLSCKKNEAWKLLEAIIISRQGLSRKKKSVIFLKLIPENIFPDPL